MSATAKAMLVFERDSNEAISHAMLEGDYRYVSDDVRQKLDDWLRRTVEAGLSSGTPILADDDFFEGIKRRGRERLGTAEKQ